MKYEEFTVGSIPPSGEDYDEDEYPMPAWSEVLEVLRRENISECIIIAIGKGVCSSPPCGAGTVGTSVKFLARELIDRGLLRFVKKGRNLVPQWKGIFLDPEDTPDITQDLFKLRERPDHIAAFVIKKIS
jgi:hypothetical protein